MQDSKLQQWVDTFKKVAQDTVGPALKIENVAVGLVSQQTIDAGIDPTWRCMSFEVDHGTFRVEMPLPPTIDDDALDEDSARYVADDIVLLYYGGLLKIMPEKGKRLNLLSLKAQIEQMLEEA